MSWISENYEKAAIGVGAVALIGLAYVGLQKAGSVEGDFSGSAAGLTPTKGDPSVAGADKVAYAKLSLLRKRELLKGDDKGRAVDWFTGVPLFVNKNDPSNPVDISDPNVAPVHPPIPNKWWIDNRIDPGFADSPQRDADEDGFSNLDEFNAKTDPNDKKSYPSLITKLTYSGDEFVQWVLRPGFPDAAGSFTFKYNDTLQREARNNAADPAKPGDTFFSEGPIKDRFKFIGAEKKMEMNDKFNAEVEVTIVTVEDMKPNKLGMKYEIPASFRNADRLKYSKFDRTAILTLEALGLEGQEMKVEEFTEFALPPDAKEKAFKLTAVTPESITIEHKNAAGKIETYTILKGATGPEAP